MEWGIGEKATNAKEGKRAFFIVFVLEETGGFALPSWGKGNISLKIFPVSQCNENPKQIF